MAYSYGSLVDDWEDLGSAYREQPISRSADPSGISIEAKQILENAFTVDPYPSLEATETIAYQSGLDIEKVYPWFSNRRARDSGGDAEPHHRLSEYSDLPNTIAPLGPPGPVSVQSDVQFTSSWLDNKADSGADSGFFSNPSVASSVPHYLDSSNYSTSFSQHIATDPSLGVFSEQLQPALPADVSSDVDPWFPGSRLDQQKATGASDYSLNPIFDLSAEGQSYQNALAHGQLSNSVYGFSKPAALSRSLQPCTVSSEAIGSVQSRNKHASVKTQGDIITCDRCGAQFSGRYRRGNCSRHVRQQHSGKSAQLSSDCLCRVCKKRFNRQDARRKHEWKKHQLQDTRPYPRRPPPTQEYESSHTGTNDTYSDQGTLTWTHTQPEEPTARKHYRIPAQPLRAHNIFAAIKTELGDNAYDSYCAAFLDHSECIVEALENEQPDVHHVFARVLQSISVQLLPEQLESAESPSTTEAYPVDAEHDTSHDNDKSTNTRSHRGKAIASRRPSTASKRAHPYPRRTSKQTSGSLLIELLELFEKPECLDLDCPVHKWYLAHVDNGMTSPCKGCAEEHMNGVRQHLLPSYSQQHERHVSFIRRCGRCKEDIVDEAVWDSGGHRANTCPGNRQARGISVVIWARLFLKIFPGEIRVPSPYLNDLRFLPDELVALIRRDLQLISPVSSNLPPICSAPRPTLGNETPRRDEARDLDNIARLPWLEQSLEERVTLDILISRTTHFLEELKAEKQVQMTRNIGAIQDIEADYHDRLHDAQQLHLRQPNEQLQPAAQHPANQTPNSMPELRQIQAPIIGGADFEMPKFQPDVLASVAQNPDAYAYADTQPTTQDYHRGEFSFRMTGSSQTSYDFGSSTYGDQSQSASTHFYAPVEPSECPPSVYFPESQWPLLYDPRLDVPGSSRLPQAIAEEYTNARLAAEVDRIRMIESSPSRSLNEHRVSTSHTPTNFVEDLFAPDTEWYGH